MLSPALFIGRRYASLRSRNQLVSFLSLLSVAGISLGVAILIMVLSVINGFDRELQQRVLGIIPHLTVTSERSSELMNETQWQDIREQLEQHPQVVGSAPYIQVQGMLLANGRSKGILLNGIEPEQEQQVSVINDLMSSGDLSSLQDRSYNIAIGAGIAETLNLQMGDSVMLVSTVFRVTPLGEFPRKKRVTVSAIFEVGSELDKNLALLHIGDVQRLYRLNQGIHGYRLQTNDLFSVIGLRQTLAEEMPDGLMVSDWTYSYGPIYENIRFSKTLVGLLLSLLVAVAVFNLIVSLIMVVRDKQGDIAILRTMGISVGTIRRIFIYQGFLIGLAGALSGLLLGIILSLSAGSMVAWLESILNVELLSKGIYPVNYLPADIRFSDLFWVCLLALLLSIVATLYPASRAASTRPAEILRHE